MRSETKALAIRAIRNELGNVQDDLYRYRLADQKAKTGNGETNASVVERLESKQIELEHAIRELEAL